MSLRTKPPRKQLANKSAKADRGELYNAYAATHEGVPPLPENLLWRLSKDYFEECESFPSLYAYRWAKTSGAACPQLKRWVSNREVWELQKQYMKLAEQQARQEHFDPSSSDDSDDIDQQIHTSLKRIRVQDTGHMWHNPFQSIF